MEENNVTLFSEVYDSFFGKVTDSMYLEITYEETVKLLNDLLISAIPRFEFPRKNIFDYSRAEGHFNIKLTEEEINILATYMVVEWFKQQLANVDLVRLKVSGNDFKFTSQANHMSKLTSLKNDFEEGGKKAQKVYERRTIDKDGNIVSTFGMIMGRE